MAAEALSYLHGAHQTPLLGETIGENLDRTVARVAMWRAAQGRMSTFSASRAAIAR